MNTRLEYIKHHSTTLRIGLGLALIFSFTGCSSSPGNEHRQENYTPVVGQILEKILRGGRIDPRDIGGFARIIVSTEFEASRLDEQYARERAISYQPKTNAPNLAIRTKSSKNKSQPEVVVVNRKTREVISSYKLDNRPDDGQKIKLQNTLMCEYVP
jgi:hypothetical protein